MLKSLDAILVAADVHSLYTNMQPNKGLEARRKNAWWI